MYFQIAQKIKDNILQQVKWYEIQILVSTNKVLLEFSLFVYIGYGYFCDVTSGLIGHRLYGSHNLKYLLSGVFQQQCAHSWLRGI